MFICNNYLIGQCKESYVLNIYISPIFTNQIQYKPDGGNKRIELVKTGNIPP